MRYSKKSLKDLSIAVARYNSMRSKFINKNKPAFIPPAASVDAIKEQSINTAMLRQHIKMLNDYKRIEDFNMKEGIGFNITRGEYRTYQRLHSAEQRRVNKQIEALRRERIDINTPEIRQAEITREMVRLKTPKTNIKTIKTRAGFKIGINTLQKAAFIAQTGSAEYVSKDHFIAALNSLGMGFSERGRELMKKISRMNERSYYKFATASRFISLNYVYDMGISIDSKIDEISAVVS